MATISTWKKSAICKVDNRYDVVVIGGGVAGSTTALALRSLAQSVALFESASSARRSWGETLPPDARVPLTTLGVWDRFQDSGPIPLTRKTSVWGKCEIEEESFIFNAYGDGWLIDRPRFDKMLVTAAEESGVEVSQGSRVVECEWLPVRREWRCSIETDGIQRSVHASFVVDGTGRSASHARRTGARKLSADRLIAVIGLMIRRSTLPDHQTLVEATEFGWWYSAPLGDSELVLLFMTDSDLLPANSAGIAAAWRRELSFAEHTRARIDRPEVRAPFQVVTASTSRLDRATGPSWLAVGDAAQTFDPLSSRGIVTALHSGINAASAITRYQQGQPDAVEEFEATQELDFEGYLAEHRAHYAREQRWPDSAFWRRRHLSDAVSN